MCVTVSENDILTYFCRKRSTGNTCNCNGCRRNLCGLYSLKPCMRLYQWCPAGRCANISDSLTSCRFASRTSLYDLPESPTAYRACKIYRRSTRLFPSPLHVQSCGIKTRMEQFRSKNDWLTKWAIRTFVVVLHEIVMRICARLCEHSLSSRASAFDAALLYRWRVIHLILHDPVAAPVLRVFWPGILTTNCLKHQL